MYENDAENSQRFLDFRHAVVHDAGDDADGVCGRKFIQCAFQFFNFESVKLFC